MIVEDFFLLVGHFPALSGRRPGLSPLAFVQSPGPNSFWTAVLEELLFNLESASLIQSSTSSGQESSVGGAMPMFC